MENQLKLASCFRKLNTNGRFLLANAWDIASAKIFANEGFLAIGTTSGGIAYSHGHQDSQKINADVMFQKISSIVNAVSIPVTADIESGYGVSAAEVYISVKRAISIGVVGINIEDNGHDSQITKLFDINDQCIRLSAARKAANDLRVPIWINARIDTYLTKEHDDDLIFEVTIERANAYLSSGADMVFIPGIDNLTLLARLKKRINGPINIMVMPGSPDVDKLFNAGASRVSLGVCPMLSCMGIIKNIANDFITHGTSQIVNDYFYGFEEAESLFK